MSEYLSANSVNKWGTQQCEQKHGVPPELVAEWPKYDTASRLVRTEPPRIVGETLARAQRQFFLNASREGLEPKCENIIKQRHQEDELKGKDIK